MYISIIFVYIGAVIKKFPAGKSIKKFFKLAALTGTEDYISTKEACIKIYDFCFFNC